MNKEKERRIVNDRRPLSERIGSSEELKMKARKSGIRTIWQGFGMFGAIGWTVAMPILLGVMAGLWLDRHYPDPNRSWTLVLMAAGVAVGCAAAWSWVAREQRNMHKEE